MNASTSNSHPPVLADVLRRQAAASPGRVFAIFPGISLTYGGLFDKASALADGLRALGLEAGDHAAILMPNCADFLVAHFAVQLAGGISVLLNARSRQHELQYAIPHCDAKILLTTDVIDTHVNFTQLLREAFPGLEGATAGEPLGLEDAPLLRHIVLFGAKRWQAATPAENAPALRNVIADAERAPRTACDPLATAVMIYTSGTTADPKACELSHAGIQRSWEIYTAAVDLAAGEKVWDPMPFFHSGGIGLMTGIMARGATIVSSPHFDPHVIADLVLEHRVAHLYPGFHLLGLPVLQSPRYDRGSFDFVRTMVVVGPLGTLRLIQSLLPPGAVAMNLFGMSEGSGLVTLAPRAGTQDQRLISSGRPTGNIEVRIVQHDGDAVLPAGAEGEIQFRGGGALRGYYKNPAATRATILPDGWVRTGDLGRLDEEGWLYYLGRQKDMLKVGGENVAAAEIESFLSAHPGVKFVQVIGRPDERLGEVPVAFVERNPGATLSREDVIEMCAGKIARFKIPRDVVFVTEWPMSATKVQKFKLHRLLPPALPDG